MQKVSRKQQIQSGTIRRLILCQGYQPFKLFVQLAIEMHQDVTYSLIRLIVVFKFN